MCSIALSFVFSLGEAGLNSNQQSSLLDRHNYWRNKDTNGQDGPLVSTRKFHKPLPQLHYQPLNYLGCLYFHSWCMAVYWYNFPFTQTWDSKLQEVAQNYADKCIFAHNSARTSQSGYSSVGENIYYSSKQDLGDDLEMVVDAWDGEKKDYTLSSNECEPGKMCGHYTQVSLHCW